MVKTLGNLDFHDDIKNFELKKLSKQLIEGLIIFKLVF